MTHIWRNTGDVLSTEELVEKGRRLGVEIPAEILEFWQRETNGGRPEQNLLVEVPDLEGGAGRLHGVYGIQAAHPSYELSGALEVMRSHEYWGNLLEWFFPFGFDEGGGEILIDIVDPTHPIYYLCHDPDELVRCADNLQDFLENSLIPDDLAE